MKLVATLIGIACIASVAIGCGGGGGDDDALTKAEFVKQANAICKQEITQRDATINAALKEREKEGKVADQAFFEEMVDDVALPQMERMKDELTDLGEPSTEGEQATAIVAAYETGIANVEDELPAVLRGKVDPFEEAKELATAYGLKECSGF